MSEAPQLRDKEVNQLITGQILDLPEEMFGLESTLGVMRQTLSNARRDVEDAELEAQINAVVDGKNEEARKVQRAKAVAESAAVKAKRAELSEIEFQIVQTEADLKKLSRQFQGAIALAELQAARANLMCKLTPEKTR